MKHFILSLALLAAAPFIATAQQIENAFSPDAKAEALVLKVIDSSTTSLRMAAYSFSSPAVIEALLSARKRGVDIKVLVDYKRNQRPLNLAALNRIAKAGIPTRRVAVYAMHHDKYVIADGQTVQNGSFNYTHDAAVSNSENVVVTWNYPPLAQSFQQHWEDRWNRGVDYKPQ
ncbi:phospholipase D family protein [Duganella sp. FT135W]|uniref:phospholipase D n=1 Tax=Duganella flavida TaxID=2692175 RepID=A0A6L8K5Q5_9BURK|nr:phospholipase D family protein [Duganella flavida]MYM21847.1 phospholipase D family protein [Duganella flavida]